MNCNHGPQWGSFWLSKWCKKGKKGWPCTMSNGIDNQHARPSACFTTVILGHLILDGTVSRDFESKPGRIWWKVCDKDATFQIFATNTLSFSEHLCRSGCIFRARFMGKKFAFPFEPTGFGRVVNRAARPTNRHTRIEIDQSTVKDIKIPTVFISAQLWYCIISLCWVTVFIDSGIIPVGQFSQETCKINQSIKRRLCIVNLHNHFDLIGVLDFIPPGQFTRGRG